MDTRKPQPNLEVFFAGVYPENVPVGTLADAISALHRLATGSEDAEEMDGAAIRLLDVARGSAVFRCIAQKPDQLIQGLRRAGRWLEQPDGADELAYALAPLRRLSEVARTLDCPIVVRNPADRADVIATICPGTFDGLADLLLVTGEKTIRGKVERVGGATDTKCALRVAFQTRLLHCTVRNLGVLRHLARALYEDVVVTGVARWLKRTWRVIDFEIHEVNQPELGQLAEAFDALRKAGGDAWDKISDPGQFIREMSGTR